jgi:hypothetical protein
MAEHLVKLTIIDPAVDVQLSISDQSPSPVILRVSNPATSAVILRVNDQPGGFSAISSDPDNRLTRGSDGGLLVPDTLTPDPLAYYILARS